jgi:hypothetical protein
MSSAGPRVLKARKILVASIGVATVSYACGGTTNSPSPGNTGGSVAVGGNTGTGGSGGFTSGNLMPPPGTGGTPADAGKDSGTP